ncbi:MAG: TetR/AcrR family transcriptional regulator [Pseudomonadota bacterium]
MRTRILDTALGLLGEHGVAHLTQPRVSKAAGVRQSHLTYYFPTRGDLLVAVARHSLEAIARPLVSQARAGAISAERIPAALIEALTDRRRVRVMLGLVAAADEDPGVRDELRETVHMLRGHFSTLFGLLGFPRNRQHVALVHTVVVGSAVLYHACADDTARRDAEAAVRFVTAVLPRLHRQAPRGRAVRKKTRGPL